MPTLAELQSALVNAHAAGDKQASTILANEIHASTKGLDFTRPLDAENRANALAARQTPETPGMAGSFFREGARSFGPGLAGFATGAKTGALLGAAGMNPFTVIGGGLAGGIGGYLGVRKLQDMGADAVAPDSFMGTASAQEDFETNPWSSMIGGGFGGGGAPGPLRALTSIPRVMTSGGRQTLAAGMRPGATPAARQAASDIFEPIVGAGVGAGMGVATGADATGVAEQTGLGLIFNRGWMHRLRPQLSTDTQNGVQGDPATGLPARAGVVPLETSAAVGNNPSRAFDIMEANALAQRLKTGQALETPPPQEVNSPLVASEPLTFDGGPEVRGPMIRGPVVEGPVVRGPVVEGPRGPVVGEAPPREAWQGPRPIEPPVVRGPQVDRPVMDGPLGPLPPRVQGPLVGEAPAFDAPLPVRPPVAAAPEGPSMRGPSVDRPFVDGPLGPEVLGPGKPKVGQNIFSDAPEPPTVPRLPAAPEPAPVLPKPPLAPEPPLPPSRQLGGRTFETSPLAKSLRTPAPPEPSAPTLPTPPTPKQPSAATRVSRLKKEIGELGQQIFAQRRKVDQMKREGMTKRAIATNEKTLSELRDLQAQRKVDLAEAKADIPSVFKSLSAAASRILREVNDNLGSFKGISDLGSGGRIRMMPPQLDLILGKQGKGITLSPKEKQYLADNNKGGEYDGYIRLSDIDSMPGTPAGREAAKHLLRSIYDRHDSPTARGPDSAVKGKDPGTLWSELRSELADIAKGKSRNYADEQDAIWARKEAEVVAFDKAVEDAPAKGKKTPEELELESGDTLTIDGEPITVGRVTDETVTLRDGERFGDQTIPVDQPIPAKNVESQAKADRLADEAPDAIAADKDRTARQVAEEDAPAAAKPAAPKEEPLVLKAHDNDAQIKAEKAAAKLKEELAKRAAAKLKGDAGDLTPDIFGEGDTPLFNNRRDTPAASTPETPAQTAERKGAIASLKEHQAQVEGFLKSEQKSGRLNSMPIDILGAQVYNNALKLIIKGMEAGQSIGVAVRNAVARIKKDRELAKQQQLTRDEEAMLKADFIAKAQEQQRFAAEKDAKFMREMPKLAQEMVANGKTPTLPNLIDGLAKRFPDQAKYIRKNGDKIYADMMFARDTRLSRTTESQREWGEWADSVMESARKVADYTTKGAMGTDIKRIATVFHATYMTGIGNKMRHLAEGNITGSPSTAWGKFTEDLVGLAKGKDGVHRVATDLAMDRDVQTFANHLDSIKRDLGPMLKAMPRRERRAFMERVGDHITDKSRDGELASQPDLKRAVEAYVKIREDLLKHMKDAGVEVGDVGPRSMRRVLDRQTILSNEGEFVRQAAAAYKSKWRREVAALNKEAASLDPVKNKDRLASIRKEITEIGKRDATDSAKKYFTNIEADDIGITADGNDLINPRNGNPSSMKSREFGPEADQLLGKFYLRDPDAILRREIADSVRAAGVAKTFSSIKDGAVDPLGKWKALRKEMIAEGNADMVPLAATLLKEHFNLGGVRNPVMHKALEIAHTHGQLAFLARATLSSLGEPALAGIRTGSLSDVARGYVGLVKGMAKELRGLGPDEARILSNAIGASSDGINAILASTRFLDSYALGGKSGELVANFHGKTWLNALTQTVHAVSLDIGQKFLRSQLDLRMANGKYKATAGKALNELGIATKDIPSMVKFMDDLAVSTDKLKTLTADTPEAKMYRDAMHLFKTSGGSLYVTRGNRPQFANSPAGGMFYAFKSFLFAFQDQVLSRHVRLMKTAAKGEVMVDGAMETLTPAERTKMVGETMQAIATIAAAQFAIQMVRESLFSDPARRIDESKTPADKVKDRVFSVATRSSFFGGYDTVYNMFTGARHGGNPATVLLGPSLGAAADLASQTVGVVAGDKNSPNTNTAERKLVRSIWGVAVQPTINAAFATLPGSFIPATMVQAGSHPGTREAAIRGIAGKPMIQGGPMRKRQQAGF